MWWRVAAEKRRSRIEACQLNVALVRIAPLARVRSRPARRLVGSAAMPLRVRSVARSCEGWWESVTVAKTWVGKWPRAELPRAGVARRVVAHALLARRTGWFRVVMRERDPRMRCRLGRGCDATIRLSSASAVCRHFCFVKERVRCARVARVYHDAAQNSGGCDSLRIWRTATERGMASARFQPRDALSSAAIPYRRGSGRRHSF